MVLTNARLDCVRIALDLLFRHGEHRVFDHIVFLLNKVSDRHMEGVDAYVRAHPEVAWDKVLGDGTRPAGIVAMQNECVRRYPDSLYMKIDEDVFVGAGWARRMVEAYEAYRDRDHLGLISPLIPNNSIGLHTLLHRFYPDQLAEHRRLFGRDPSPERVSFTWHSPRVAEWATRLFLDIEAANAEQRKRLAATGQPRFFEFPFGFSIGCIAYDHRLWQKMGGIPPTDEPGWCQWIEEHGHVNVLDCSQLVLHYSFFVQQEWLDRTSLIEDIRRVNLPGTQSRLASLLARAARLARQVPAIIRRRVSRPAP